MKTGKDKKNSRSVLICAVSIMLVLGMLTGCSVQDSASSGTQSDASFSSEGSKDQSNEDAASVGNSLADNPALESESTQASGEILSLDGQEIQGIAEKFAAAYFSGDIETVQSCLTNPYEWDVEVYEGTETINNLTIKGLADIGECEIGSSKVISIEYKSSETEDTFEYLTLEFVKQKDGWKIQFYGMEQ